MSVLIILLRRIVCCYRFGEIRLTTIVNFMLRDMREEENKQKEGSLQLQHPASTNKSEMKNENKARWRVSVLALVTTTRLRDAATLSQEIKSLAMSPRAWNFYSPL